MKWAMIADDLTGANDSGVQLVRDGLSTTVFLDIEAVVKDKQEALVIDTDSRLLSPEEAYKRVSRAANHMRQLHAQMIYKKLDSTLRGNIGAELDAMYDVFQPDFIVIAPSFPANGRTMRDGHYFVFDRLLHESEAAKDPATPVKQSYVPSLLEAQTKQSIRWFSISDLQHADQFHERLALCKAEKQHYLLFDAESSDDLALIVRRMLEYEGPVVWAGSAGLAQCLSASYGERPSNTGTDGSCSEIGGNPVLTICGSVHRNTQQQVRYMLEFEDTAGVEVRGEVLLAEELQGKTTEIDRVVSELARILKAGKHAVLHTCSDEHSIQATAKIAAEAGLASIGSKISALLGKIARKLLEKGIVPDSLLLTGGDTARQVCHQLELTAFELADEIEPGIPIGRFKGTRTINGVTKSGGFGSERSLRTALETLKGEWK